MRHLVEFLFELSKERPMGFTYDIFEMEEVTTGGYSVAYAATQNQFGIEGLTFCVEHALHHDGIVGGWNGEDGFYYFDSSRIFDSLEEAMAAAKEANQLALYDLYEGKTIWLE